MTHLDEQADRTTLVVGASRGLGRGIATAIAEAGGPVIAVARSETALAALAGAVPGVRPEVADAGDPSVTGTLLDRYDPRAVVLVAGARPLVRPLQQQTWETFSVNWHTDVRIAFHWIREALLKPLGPGSRVIVISSGAALQGSPLSGGYAGAKATQRFITAYAQEEANRAALAITFTTVLPRITPHTDPVVRRSGPTRPAAARPSSSTSSSSANPSPQRSPARRSSSSCKQIPQTSPRAICSPAPDCSRRKRQPGPRRIASEPNAP